MNNAAVVNKGFDKSRSICCISERLDSYLKESSGVYYTASLLLNKACELYYFGAEQRRGTRLRSSLSQPGTNIFYSWLRTEERGKEGKEMAAHPEIRGVGGVIFISDQEIRQRGQGGVSTVSILPTHHTQWNLVFNIYKLSLKNVISHFGFNSSQCRGPAHSSCNHSIPT